jgi:hypothetical protein
MMNGVPRNAGAASGRTDAGTLAAVRFMMATSVRAGQGRA